MDQSDQLRKSRQKCHQEAAARRQTSWCVASNVLPQQEIMIQVSIWLFLTNTGLGDTSTATQLWGKSQTSMKSICILGEIYIPEKWSGKKHWLLLLGASLPTAQHSWLMPDVAPPPREKKKHHKVWWKKKVFGEWKFPGISYQRYQVYDADIDPKVPPWTLEIPHSVRMIRWETLAAARQVRQFNSQQSIAVIIQVTFRMFHRGELHHGANRLLPKSELLFTLSTDSVGAEVRDWAKGFLTQTTVNYAAW